MRLRTSHLLPVAGLIAVIAVFVVVLAGSGSTAKDHTLVATVKEASNVLAGQEVTSGGRAIGQIDEVRPLQRGRMVELRLRIDDDAWPLPRGTRFLLRYGGTVAIYDRYVEVTRGPEDAPPMTDGGAIPARDFQVPVEVDDVLSTFGTEVRRDLKSFVNRSGETLSGSRKPLARVLTRTPQALDEATAVLRDVIVDPGTLDTVLRRTDAVVGSVSRANPGLSTLLEGTERTFDAIATQQRQVRGTLERLPGTLEQARTTLGKADGTLQRAGRLATRIAPGVRELDRVASPLDRVLAGVQRIGPDAVSTLATAERSGPKVQRLLARATTLAPQLASISDQIVENVRCIRPYSPELMGFLMAWADFLSWNDGRDKIIRAQLQSYLPANYNSVALSPGQLKKAQPQIRYGFPRPPGYNAGQPWFLPECGVGPDALDPSKDKEGQAAPLNSALPPELRGKGR